MDRKFFPKKTKDFLSETKENPNEIFIAAGEINNLYCLRGPRLKIRLHDEFMIISHFNRAIKVKYSEEITISKRLLSSCISFEQDNNKYEIYPYSKKCIDYVKNKCLNEK